MQRLLAWLVVALATGVLATATPANAAAFLWVAASNWSYAGTTCGTESSAIYSWFLAAGTGATAEAYSSCSQRLGTAGAFAIAQAGEGGGGAAFFNHGSNTYTGDGVDTALVNPIGSESYQTDETDYSSEFDHSFTVTTSGVAFGSDFSAELHDVSEVAAFDYTGPTDGTDLCTKIDATSCGTGESSRGGDVTNLNSLENDLHLSGPLGTLTDPSGGSTLNFTSALTGSTSDVILVGEGNAVPEPSSLLVFGAGLLEWGLAAAWRHRRSRGRA